MPATLARVSLITQDFRWDLQFDAAVAGKRLRARVVDEESYCSTEVGATTINAAILNLLKGDSQLLEVSVNPLPASLSFDRLAPIVTLNYEPLNLVRDMIVVGRNITIKADGFEKGSLLLW